MNFLKHQHDHSSSSHWDIMNQELQEPVPFEDFEFSFGLDPDFSIPVPLDMPPPLTTSITNSSSSSSTTSSSTSSSSLSGDPMLSEEIFSFDSFLPQNVQSVLDEQDQKTFSSFLDTFIMDQLPIQPPTDFDTTTTIHPYMMPSSSPSSSNHTNPSQSIKENEIDIEEERRNSILQSLDHQKQKLHERLNFLASTASSTPINSINTTTTTTTTTTTATTSNTISNRDHSAGKKRKSSVLSTIPSYKKPKQTHKELLTEEEKRANHIASEQKRRSTIRSGFKELTDIIPTLKNIHHSKSTVLFKAVDFIKYLDRRNKSKREKIKALELRLAMKRSKPDSTTTTKSMITSPRSTDSDTSMTLLPPLLKQPHDVSSSQSTVSSASSASSSSSQIPCPDFPPSVSAALLAHKSQQQQLLQLQEQLQLHQRLLARQQEMKEKAIQAATGTLLPPLRTPSSKNKQGFRAVVRHDPEDDPFYQPTLST